MSEAGPEADPLATARQLGERYAALAGREEWQIDEVMEAIPVAEPVADVPPPEVSKKAPPPVAEAANDVTVPPTPLQIVEALLFVGGLPLSASQAEEAVRGLNEDQFRQCIDTLNRVYRSQNRPYAVVHGLGGYVLRLKPRYAAIREKLHGGPREARLNQTALDVLALVAYRQPVSKGDVDAARGADSGGILRQLVRLGLVASVRLADGADLAYETTPRFLEVFRLRDLDDLPRVGEAVRI